MIASISVPEGKMGANEMNERGNERKKGKRKKSTERGSFQKKYI